MVFAAAELDEHATPPWHPERRERLDAALAGIGEAGLGEATAGECPSRPATTTWPSSTTPRTSPRRGVLRRRWRPARPRHVGRTRASLTARRIARRGARRHRRAAARRRDSPSPPSAHPGTTPLARSAMGFCLFNNVAVGGRGAGRRTASGSRSSTGTSTTATARRTSSTTTRACSSCRSTSRRSTPAPAQPTRRGAGAGAGPRSTSRSRRAPTGDVYRRGVRRRGRPGRRAVRARLVIVSAGFDAHRTIRSPGCAHQCRLRRHGHRACRRPRPPPCDRRARRRLRPRGHDVRRRCNVERARR